VNPVNYLLDTNHWSYLQRNDPAILTHIQNLPEQAITYMPVITQAELLVGVALAASEQRRQQLQELYEQVITKVTNILPITSQVAQHYAAIFVNLRHKGRPIPTNDIWIAAIAKAHNLILVSNDEHFQYIDGLQLENWIKS
jgi:tRNA(fMet)-specific endonuclease VapC